MPRSTRPRQSSAVLLLAALALLAACGETPTAPSGALAPTAPALAVGGGNSLNAKSCQKNGWKTLVTSTGAAFASEEACVAYAAKGGTLYRSQTITFAALAGKTFGDPDFGVSATASSGLAVTFTASDQCTVAGSTVHLTGGGACTITAHQSGNATWYPAPDVARSFAIAKADQTIAFTSTSPSSALAGATYTPTATATSGLAVAITLDATSTGCSLAAGVVSFTTSGTCIIDANQAGDASWNPAAQQQQSITVLGCIGSEAALRTAAAAGGSYDFCAAGTRVVLTAGEVSVVTALTLNGVGGANGIVDANGGSRVFSITGGGSLTLNDVTVTGGRVSGSGGGIDINGGTAVLNGNSAVDRNAAWYGGGVQISYGGGSLTMNDASTVSNNLAVQLGANVTTAGGGVYVNGSSYLTMNGTSTVRGNTVQGAVSIGGGVTNNAGNITLNGSSAITGNAAAAATFSGQSRGGGVYFVNGGSLTLNASASITGNAAVDAGGGIFRIDGGIGTIAGVTATNVSGNTPNNCAGTVAVPGCVP